MSNEYLDRYLDDAAAARVGTFTVMSALLEERAESTGKPLTEKVSKVMSECHNMAVDAFDSKAEFLDYLLRTCHVYAAEALMIIDQEAVLSEAEEYLEEER